MTQSHEQCSYVASCEFYKLNSSIRVVVWFIVCCYVFCYVILFVLIEYVAGITDIIICYRTVILHWMMQLYFIRVPLCGH